MKPENDGGKMILISKATGRKKNIMVMKCLLVQSSLTSFIRIDENRYFEKFEGFVELQCFEIFIENFNFLTL